MIFVTKICIYLALHIRNIYSTEIFTELLLFKCIYITLHIYTLYTSSISSYKADSIDISCIYIDICYIKYTYMYIRPVYNVNGTLGYNVNVQWSYPIILLLQVL